MKLLKNKYKLRCETGGCRNYAGYVLLMDRCGVHSSVYLCENCVNELKKALRAACENDDGLNEALLCGGVASSALLRELLAKRLAGGVRLYFGQSALSGDNAVGAALLAADEAGGDAP